MGTHNGGSNSAPTIDTITYNPGPIVDEGKRIHVEIFASDADGDNLLFSAVSLPAGGHLQTNTSSGQAYFTWQPDFDDNGTHTVSFKVEDEDVGVFHDFNITVAHVNQAPTLDVIRDGWVYELDKITYDLSAVDPDGDSLEWEFTALDTANHTGPALPTGVFADNFGSYEGGLSWIPDCTQGAPTSPALGGGSIYEFQVNVTDGQYNDTRRFNITVYHTDAPAELIPISHKRVIEGDLLTFNITATACDDEEHYLEVGTVSAVPASVDPAPLPADLPWSKSLPLNVAVTPEDALEDKTVPMLKDNVTKEYFSVFTWDTGFDQAGNYTFYANVTDAAGNTDSIKFTILVAENNTAPFFDILPTCASAGTCYGKEDTWFHLTQPLGSTTDTDFWNPQCSFRVIPVACGTPFVATVADNENDRIFWNIEWLTLNGQNVSGGILPDHFRFIAPGSNWTTGEPDRPDMEPVAASSTAAFIHWWPDYNDAGAYGFRLSANDGINVTDVYFEVLVEQTNQRPFVHTPENITVFEGKPIRFTVDGYDKDLIAPVIAERDVVRMYMGDQTTGNAAIPAGADWSDGHSQDGDNFTGEFRWTPDFHQAGVYELQVWADDARQGHMFPGHPLGYGDHSNVTDFDIRSPDIVRPTPWAHAGWTGEVAADSNTEFHYVTAVFNITVLNLDRPPVISDIGDQSVAIGSGVYAPFSAFDPDFDPVVFNFTGAPAFLSLTDNGDGTGFLSGTATVGGVWDILVEACSSATACDNTTFRLVVIADTEYTVAPQGAFYEGSPGTPVTIPIKVSNTGPAVTDAITFELIFEDGTTGTSAGTVSVASGTTEWANATVVLQEGVDRTRVRIVATSAVDPSYVKTSTVFVDVPMVVSVTMSSTTPGTIQGQVNMTFLNGDPVVGKLVTVTQSPEVNPLGALSTSAKGWSAQDGTFVFSFPAADRSANLPGVHDLLVSIAYGDGVQEYDGGSYTVGA